MKKTTLIMMAGALLFGASCTSTSTESNPNTTAETTTDATGTGVTVGETTTTAGTATSPGAAVTGTSSTNPGAAGTGPGGRMEADVTTVTNLNDATFLMTAYSMNMLEMEASRMALQRATSADVKQYSQMIINDHQKANQQLTNVARQLNVELPPALIAAHQQRLEEIKGKSGKGFDEDYMDMMENSHAMGVAMFEAKTNNAQNQGVKSFANTILPTLRTHLEAANRLEDTVD